MATKIAPQVKRRRFEITSTNGIVSIRCEKRLAKMAAAWILAGCSILAGTAYCDGWIPTSPNNPEYGNTRTPSPFTSSFSQSYMWSGPSPAPQQSYWLLSSSSSIFSDVPFNSFSITPGTAGTDIPPNYGGAAVSNQLIQKSGSPVSASGTVSITYSGGYDPSNNLPFMVEDVSLTPVSITIIVGGTTAGGTAGGSTGGGTTTGGTTAGGGTTTGGTTAGGGSTGGNPNPTPSPTPTPTPPGGSTSTGGDTAGGSSGGDTSGGTTGGGSTGGGGTGGGGIISIGGATQDSSGNWDILVGQQCTPTLSAPTGYTISNYTWSATGTTFQSWSPTTPAIGSNPANPNASYYVGGITGANTANPGWYWNDPQPTTGPFTAETITCLATVTPPYGGPAQLSFTQIIRVYTPKWTAFGTGGIMQVKQGWPNEPSTDYFLGAGPVGSEYGGMNWIATIAAPPKTPFASGSIALCQLINKNREYADFNSMIHTDIYNGTMGLDGYPCIWTSTSPTYQYNDNPGIDLTAHGAIQASENDTFNDYLMYTPPNSNQAVPLATFTWSDNGAVSIPSGGSWANQTPSPNTVTPNASTPFTNSNTFPSWTANCSSTIWN